MRQGWNPEKGAKKLDLATHHRVIVVVFIPNDKGFYQKSFEVFKTCLDSLATTINSDSVITVVNNGSFDKVTDFLAAYLKTGKIDTVIHHKNNIGKIDALIGAARGVREQLITFSDADILFLKGWQENVEEVFCNFKNTGSVSPIPSRLGLFAWTSSVLANVLTHKIKFKYEQIPENFEPFNRYLESINWGLENNPNNLWPVVLSKKSKAIVGSGHQVLTVLREIVLNYAPKKPSLTLVGGDSELKYVDKPIDVARKMRLSTYNNYAYHMGNEIEPWMNEAYLKSFETFKKIQIDKNTIALISPKQQTFFKYKIYAIRKLIVKKLFKILFFK